MGVPYPGAWVARHGVEVLVASQGRKGAADQYQEGEGEILMFHSWPDRAGRPGTWADMCRFSSVSTMPQSMKRQLGHSRGERQLFAYEFVWGEKGISD